MPKDFFFVFVTCIAMAVILQFWLYTELVNTCSSSQLHIAPLVAGECLASSLLTNWVWLVVRRKKWSVLVRLSLFVWVLSVSTGLVAVGATLGQTQLYNIVCPDYDRNGVDINLLQCVSGVLLLLSIAAPHVYTSRKAEAKEGAHVYTSRKAEAKEVEGAPLLPQNPSTTLNFL
jgi:hypothetical protein